MQHNSQRGAAHISAIWFIAVLVLFFGTAFLAYQGSNDRKAAEDQTAAVQQDLDDANARVETLTTQMLELSREVGHIPEGATESSTDNVKAGVAALKSGLGDMPGVGDTYEEVAAGIPAMFAAQLQANAALSSSITDLRGQLTNAQAQIDSITSSKDEEIRQKEQALADAIDAANRERGDLEDQISTLRNTINNITGERNAANAARDQAETNLIAAENAAQSNIANLSKTIQDISGIKKAKHGPDGEVLDASATLNVAFLNLGARDKVSRGMVFTVTSGRPGSDLVKGKVEVTDVMESMCQAKIFDLADVNDPIVQGDILDNPVFQPGAEQNAVLAGRFGGTWTESDLKLLLGDIGITVQSTLDNSTSLLIVGEPLYLDPETDEALEDPIPVSELEVYKTAEAKGIQIVHIGDLRRFFKK